MRHLRNRSSNLLLFFVINQFLTLTEAQTSSNTTTPSSTANQNITKPTAIVGAVFGAVIAVSLVMVSVLYWVRRQARKAIENREGAMTALESRKKGRYGTQNTSYGLDTTFTVPTGLVSFNFEKNSTGVVPQPYRYNSSANAPLEQRPYEPTRRQSFLRGFVLI
jgi:hypothetical protein